MFTLKEIIYSLSVFISLGTVLCSNSEIKVSNGYVSGRILKTLLEEKEYLAYEGIPYAEPPIKDLRFEPPVPKSNWDGVYEAIKIKQPCPQFNHNLRKGKGGPYGSEDCLYLDIYTPDLSGAKPVIVFLQNLNFYSTNNKTKHYQPDFFIEEDVIIVTISHRLGVLGFLSLESPILPGNNGLRDILLALEWLRANVKQFGGDPDKVTLMGQLGGGAAVDILLHSKNATGLFSKAIIQSATSCGSIYFSQHAKDDSYRLAEMLDIVPISDADFLKLFKKLDTYQLVGKEFHAAHQDFTKSHQTGILSFGPVVEPDSPEAVVTVLPEKDNFKLDIPLMIGFNSEEGLEASELYLNEPRYLSYVEKDLLIYLPLRGLRFALTGNAYYHGSSRIKNFYFDGKVKISEPSDFVRYIGDAIHAYPTDYAVKQYAKNAAAPIYYYQFDYDGKFNGEKIDLLKTFSYWDEKWGAATGDELCYLFLCPKLTLDYKRAYDEKSNDIIALRKIVKLWTNFAKYGNPTPKDQIDILEGVEWKSVTEDSHQYLHISNALSMQKDPMKERFKFWDNFMEMYSKIAVNGFVQYVKDEL